MRDQQALLERDVHYTAWSGPVNFRLGRQGREGGTGEPSLRIP